MLLAELLCTFRSSPGLLRREQLLLQRLLLFIQLRQQGRAVALACAEILFSPLQHRLRQPEPPGGRHSAAGSRDAVSQPVFRRQRLRVELDSGVLNSLFRMGVMFELTQVSGQHRFRPLPAKLVEHRLGQRRPFRRVGAGAGLVQQHQGLAVGLLENRLDPQQMAGKSRQAFGNTLLVADVDVQLLEQVQPAVRMTGDMESRAHHQQQQPQSFQCDRFTAGIRTADHQRMTILRQQDVDRHCLGRFQATVDVHQ